MKEFLKREEFSVVIKPVQKKPRKKTEKELKQKPENKEEKERK